MKTLQKDYTTPEQSKRLLELGVPANSANLYSQLGFENLIWVRNTKNELREDFFEYLINGKSANIPIWSFGRLIEILFICSVYEVRTIRSCRNDSPIDDIIYEFENNKMDFSKLEE